MIGWLYRTIIGRFGYCEHKWATIDITNWKDPDTGNKGSFIKKNCTKCGKWKKQTV